MPYTYMLEVLPRSQRERLLFSGLLEALADFFNGVNSAYSQAFCAARSDAQGGCTPVNRLKDNVWSEASQEGYNNLYIQAASERVSHRIEPKNRGLLPSLFSFCRKYRAPDNTDVVEKQSQSEYWKYGGQHPLDTGNLNGMSTLVVGNRSPLVILVGIQLEVKFHRGNDDRLRSPTEVNG